MPAEFDNCVKRGGRVRTEVLSDSEYRHICFLNGKGYVGETKKKKRVFKKK